MPELCIAPLNLEKKLILIKSKTSISKLSKNIKTHKNVKYKIYVIVKKIEVIYKRYNKSKSLSFDKN